MLVPRCAPCVLPVLLSVFLLSCMASEEATDPLDSDQMDDSASEADPASSPDVDLASDARADSEVSTESISAVNKVKVKLADSEECFFATFGDRVHLSGSEASGHGWWINIDCPPALGRVTVQLQEFIGHAWRNVGTVGEKTVRAGGGRGKRATARAQCRSRSLTSWRSVIDVDLIDLPDDPDKTVTPSTKLRCRS